jgi:hypothetical protein
MGCRAVVLEFWRKILDIFAIHVLILSLMQSFPTNSLLLTVSPWLSQGLLSKRKES